MKSLIFILISFLALSACSTTTWIVQQEDAIDRGDYKLLDSELFLRRNGSLSPENPIIQFKINSANTFEYVQRIKTDRYIQRYRPKLGYLLLGVSSSALTGYTALELTDPDKTGQQIALLGASASLLGISFLNMKAVGEPQPTGETRLMRKTGTYTDTDTLPAPEPLQETLDYNISYNGQALTERNDVQVNENTFNINFLEEVNPEIFSGFEQIELNLNVFFRDSLYDFAIPVEDIFEPFVVITSPVTALRNNPEQNPNNVLTDLAQGSQLKLVERQGEWVKVLYGISENWVSVNDVQTIWRPSQFSNQLSVVAIPNVPFGSVDVERDIPRLVSQSSNKYGLIISNQSYSGNNPEKAYAHRDAQLIEKYYTDALGMDPQRVVKSLDVNDNTEIEDGLSDLISQVDNQDSQLLVYLNGYAKVDPVTDRVKFLGTSTDSVSSLIDLNSFFDRLAQLEIDQLSVIADLDFIGSEESGETLEILSAVVTTQVPNSVVVFSSAPNQRSYVYAEPNGVQKRHTIFTYFLADALKNRNTNWADIRSFLQRNISFTSRSIFNAPQDILFFGNDSLDIID